MPLNAALRAKLPKLVPNDLLVTRSWLMEQGIVRHAIDNLVKSEQLLPIRPGVYMRPGGRLVWEGVVRSLQRMGSNLVVGGTSALDLQGASHYLALWGLRVIRLHGTDPLPPWTNRLGLPQTFCRHGTAWLLRPDAMERNRDQHDMVDTVEITSGDDLQAMQVSTLERALLEVLKDVPTRISFEHADNLMAGLIDLSPCRLGTLLHRTRNFKVKRLFFWMAEQQGHPWIKELDPGDFDLGRGKRVLERDGRLASRYGITVPKLTYG